MFQSNLISKYSINNLSTFNNQTAFRYFTANSFRSTMSSVNTNAKVVLRKSADRGHANHGWLDSFHTFSFADYYDPSFNGFGPLRVINEDRVSPGRGFGRHPHRDFEIFSYVVRGAVKHDDSMGNSEVIKRGEVQFTSAGTGIAHAEYNSSNQELVHFLQIWVKPRKNGLTPTYKTANFSDEDKAKKWTLIVSPESDNNAEGSITIHADCRMYAGLLKHGEQREFVARPNTQLYIHVVSDIAGMHDVAQITGVQLNDTDAQVMQSGDGAFVTFSNKGQSHSIIVAGINNNAKEGQSAEEIHKLKSTEVLIFEVSI